MFMCACVHAHVPSGTRTLGEGGQGGVRSLLEHLFCGFDRQASVCCFSRSYRGRARGAKERGGGVDEATEMAEVGEATGGHSAGG